MVSGDSCGGLLGLGVILAARDEGLALPACFVSISGWFDVSVAVENPGGGRDPVPHRRVGAQPRAGVRSRTAGLDDPRLSPAYADLSGLPPLYLPVGQHDTLRQGTEALARAAMDAGVAVTAESWPGMVHGWQGSSRRGCPKRRPPSPGSGQYLDAEGV